MSPRSLCLLVLAASLSAADLGLDNGDLDLGQGGALPGWTVRGEHGPLAQLATGLPGGLGTAVSFFVTGVASHHGQIVQRLRGIPANTRLRLSTWVRSEIPGAAYIQLKRYAGKTEIDRSSSSGKTTAAWQRFDVVIDSGEADAVEIMLRWRQEERFQRGEIGFGGVALEPATGGIALVGDSTVQDFPESGKAGWGEMLPNFVAPGTAVSNHAAGGCSSKTFRAEGRWEPVLAEQPSLILLQFGHNDSHPSGRPEATDAATDFRDHLRGYITDAKAAGIPIVLVTPPPRRIFKGELVSPTLGPYADATRAVAAESNVPLIDLYAGAGARLRELGSTGSEPLYCSLKDHSHFSDPGARWLAGMIAAGLRSQGGTSAALLADIAAWPEHGLREAR